MKKSFKLILTIFSIIIFIIIICITLSNVSKMIKEGKEIKQIYIESFPKLQYYVGEEADYSGLSLALVLKNGDIEYIQYNEETKDEIIITGFDSKKATESKKITIQYEDVSSTYYISIKDVPKPDPVLINIKIDVMPKTEYKVGEWLNTEGGMLIKEYNDGSTSRTIIINQYISGWEEAVAGGPGTYTLTITYKEGGVLKKATYDITIKE